MRIQQTPKYYYLLIVILFYQSVTGQDIKQEKMEQLSFLVGEWVGTSKIYENGIVVKEGAAYEKISYDLNKSILVIELNTEFLQLHTIINYNEIDKKYYYHRFSEEGIAIYPAEYKNGQLIVWKDDQTRFFFGITSDGKFKEYGERLVDGKWILYFEDIFMNTK